jgi:hypothetical protein
MAITCMKDIHLVLDLNVFDITVIIVLALKEFSLTVFPYDQ